jgi:ubiquinone/menaquinone biosynthesis C-methylase UbiE
MDFYIWMMVLIVLIVIGIILDREVYFYEGVHLGPRVQAWLYDHWSRKYDEGKRESQLRDAEMLARPLLELTKDIPTPFILDFATGTGRLSYVLLNQPEFKGHIVALDLSQGMLKHAAGKLGNHAPARVEFVRHQQLPLPFPDATFDVVCCLEVLELFPNMDEPLAELTRVLRPGGVMLTSRGTEESGRKAKVKSKPVFTALLEKYHLMNVEITTWWKLFDRVLAAKKGKSDPVGARTLSDVLRCGQCKQVQWKKDANAWTCQHCNRVLSVTKEGIVLN